MNKYLLSLVSVLLLGSMAGLAQAEVFTIDEDDPLAKMNKYYEYRQLVEATKQGPNLAPNQEADPRFSSKYLRMHEPFEGTFVVTADEEWNRKNYKENRHLVF